MTEQQEKVLALLTNLYYMFLEGADQLLQETEEYFHAMGVGMKGPRKVKHRLLMSQFCTMRNLMEDELEHYKISFKGDWKKYDELRKSANYLVRIGLGIGDRCRSETEVEGERERMIEEYIYHMPEKGFVTKRMLENFVIR